MENTSKLAAKFFFLLLGIALYYSIALFFNHHFHNWDTAYSIAGMLFVMIGIPVLIMVYFFYSDFFVSYWIEFLHKLGVEVLEVQHKNILLKYFPYYTHLPESLKPRFEKRLAKFMYGRKFASTEPDSEVSEIQKILISASSVQLTFGLQELSFPRLRKIIVSPSQYYNTRTKRTHKGEATTKGFMVLSWEHFLEGYATPKDALNLGLHEMAHILRIEDRTAHDGEHLFIPPQLWRIWDRNAIPVYEAIQEGNHDFLRSYAGSNSEEFFAVCVEYFFEKPHEFKQNLPKLYDALCDILRQDPVERVYRD
jgi:MtfA peptidase